VKEAFANPQIQEALEDFTRFQSDPKMREYVRQRRLFMLDMQMGMAASREEGKAEGKAEGLAEKAAETARNLKRLGVPAAVIAEATGLSSEEIARL
jgi:predicted transposase/invertase (TIGR01784 family)